MQGRPFLHQKWTPSGMGPAQPNRALTVIPQVVVVETAEITPSIVPSGSAADLTNRVRINRSKIKEEESPLVQQVVGITSGMMLAGDNREWHRIP